MAENHNIKNEGELSMENKVKVSFSIPMYKGFYESDYKI